MVDANHMAPGNNLERDQSELRLNSYYDIIKYEIIICFLRLNRIPNE